MKALLLIIVLATFASCKKEHYYCWECAKNVTPTTTLNFCDLTEKEIQDWAKDHDYTCNKK